MTDTTEYDRWIAENCSGKTCLRGLCGAYSEKMRAAFPELRLAKGLYRYLGDLDSSYHYWLVTPDGRIVDPTKSQFPCLGEGTYEEWTDEEVEERCPCGKCANCGIEIYKRDIESGDAPDRYMCSKECARDYKTYLEEGIKRDEPGDNALPDPCSVAPWTRPIDKREMRRRE